MSLRLPYSLVGLHMALDLGADGATVRALHQRMGKAQPWWPRFVPPASRGALTIAAVADAGARTGAVDGHARAIDAWARTVWTAWHSRHEAVADFTRRLKSDLR
jgi:hypothetical protein